MKSRNLRPWKVLQHWPQTEKKLAIGKRSSLLRHELSDEGAGKATYILSAHFHFIANLSWPNLTCLSPSPSLAIPPPLAYYASPHLA
jgi:hypothetical protein